MYPKWFYESESDRVENDVYVLKLSSGATIMSEVEIIESNGEEFYKLTRPVEMHQTLEPGYMDVSMIPWLIGCKTPHAILHPVDVFLMYPVSNDAIEEYSESISEYRTITKGNNMDLDNLDFNLDNSPWKDRFDY